MTERRSFASDNAAGVHPAFLDAVRRANQGHVLAYGHDPVTGAAIARIRDAFATDALVLFVFGGTGANVVGLRTAVDSYHAVLCADTSHLWCDECAAPERFLGCQLVPVRSVDGKLHPNDVAGYVRGVNNVHHAQPRILSVSQPTELGTCYTLEELRALADFAHERGMLFHVDGARLANAAAALGVPLGALGASAGVDVMALGGTKLGMLVGDAVVIFNDTLKERAGFFQKQGMQLVSKMRFIAAQFDALIADNLWRDIATHANSMARHLGDGLTAIEGVTLAYPVQTNMVYARFPSEHAARIQEDAGPFHYPTSDPRVGRLVTAWDTQPSDVSAFVDTVTRIVLRHR